LTSEGINQMRLRMNQSFDRAEEIKRRLVRLVNEGRYEA